jgi:hypothetical protein
MPVRRVFDIYSMRQLPIRYDGRVLRVATRTATSRRLRGVVVEYGGSPQEGLIFRVNARGRRSVYADNWPNRARYWLPVVDHPSDKARVLWSIQVPRGWRGVANQPECRGEGRARRCNESAPIPTYAMVLGATQQLTRSIHRPVTSGGRTIPIEVWSYPEDSAWADNGPMRRVSEIVEALDRLLGPYPYSKLSHVQSTTRFGGAMENATVVFYNERRYVAQNLPEATVRHETAHQWFSNAVTPADWPHLWLSEGFAVYFGALAGAALDGPAVLDSTLRAGMASYVSNPTATGVPLVDTAQHDPNLMLGANTYQKGAWVLHMLRHQVGDSAFFRGIRDFYRIYRDSSVHSAQFQRVMERAAGDTLDWFFRQWLGQPGYPELEIGREQRDGRHPPGAKPRVGPLPHPQPARASGAGRRPRGRSRHADRPALRRAAALVHAQRRRRGCAGADHRSAEHPAAPVHGSPTALNRSLAAALLLGAIAPALPAQESRIPRLLSELTLPERFWQLFMLPGSLDDSTHDYSNGVFGLQVPPAATPRLDAERINTIQRYFVERTRSRIPMIAFEEAVHGLRRPGATMFPQAIALAATWDTALMGRVASALAKDAGREHRRRRALGPRGRDVR